MKGAAHYFKVAVDQGNAPAQSNSGISLQNGEGVSIDIKEQHTISNLHQIKEMNLLNSIMGSVFRTVRVFLKI
jgi:TPR repeat protein